MRMRIENWCAELASYIALEREQRRAGQGKKMELNIKEVPERLKIDAESLRRYLAARLPGFKCDPGRLVVRQFSHGESNPTYHLTAAAPRELVLRRRPPGKLLPGAHRVSAAAPVT